MVASYGVEVLVNAVRSETFERLRHRSVAVVKRVVGAETVANEGGLLRGPGTAPNPVAFELCDLQYQAADRSCGGRNIHDVFLLEPRDVQQACTVSESSWT